MRERLRRLSCWLLGHDDAVIGVHAGVGAALLHCDRCQRRKAVPLQGRGPDQG